MDVHKDSITIAVLPAHAEAPTRLERLPNDLVKLKRFLDRVARDGELRTGEPVIVDIFPRYRKTRYNGDCTRTVVHGEIPDEVQRMHAAVRAAKLAAEQTIAAGVTGEAVHLATVQAMQSAGYAFGLPAANAPLSYCALTHGTGHGIGLDVHEPPLLDIKGPALLVGEALTVEPGLYRRDLGGVRIEDMVVVTKHGCDNLNTLSDGYTP